MFRDKAPDGTIRLTGAIPVGGEAGPAGPQGPPGPVGPEGPQGPEGTVDPHNHNDLYFTEAEVTDLLSGKSNALEISGGLTHVRDLVQTRIAGSNLPGSFVIQTNIPFVNIMMDLRIRGYNYTGTQTIIDLKIGGYAYSVGPQWVNHQAIDSGTVPIGVRLGRRTSDNLAVIILDSKATGNFWQYPHFTVDGAFSAGTSAQLQGWTVTRTEDLSAYTIMQTPTVVRPQMLTDTGWITPTLGAGWTSFDTSVYGPVGYRRLNGETHIRGLVLRAAANTGNAVVFNLPAGFRPARRMLEPAVISYLGGTIRRDVAENGDVVFPDGGANPANAYFSVVTRFPVDQ